jgi:hypothetical protein
MSKSKLLSLTIAGAIFAPLATFAQATTTATTTTVGATTTSATSTQIICMQNALEKRENALITAHDAFAASVKTAIQNRLTGLKASWELDRKARITKREATYKAFRTEMQTAHTAIRNTKNSTWKVYQADAKACGVRATGESASMISTANISL